MKLILLIFIIVFEFSCNGIETKDKVENNVINNTTKNKKIKLKIVLQIII